MVSIIIPIFNTPFDKLVKCLNSIENQTCREFEVLIVDNGSDDTLYRQYKEVQDSYSHLKVIRQIGGGVSAARNRGVQEAQGDYIAFVDSDDVVSPSFIFEGMQFIGQADVVISGVSIINNQDELNKFSAREINIIEAEEIDKKLINHYLTVDGDPFLSSCFPDRSKMIGRGPYAKIIKASLARETSFVENLPIGEDLIWNIELVRNARRIVLVNSVWYGYVISGNESAIRKYYGNREYLARNYLRILWKNNEEYFDGAESQFAQNVAGEFYNILNFELLSNKCELSNKEKRKLVIGYLSEWPWNILIKRENYKKLCLTHKLLVISGLSGIWIYVYRVKELIKRAKNYRRSI